MFQSSPSPKTGRYCIYICYDNQEISSNPHPVRKLGAIRIGRTEWDRYGCSNPHPVRKLGAIAVLDCCAIARNVPILTQSENWALYHLHLHLRCHRHVPILTQSENWALCLYRKNATQLREVPILTQSENWALLPNPPPYMYRLVPILTQSENWALLQYPCRFLC